MSHSGDKLRHKAARPVSDRPATHRLDRALCFCLHHWLALLLIPLLLLTITPFLAPVAMAVGWEKVGGAIYLVYSPFCHQLPQRSWFLFGEKLTYTLAEINEVFPYTDAGNLRRFVGTPALGWKVAWSDRMISFYGMTPLWGVAYALLRRTRGPIQSLLLRVLLFALAPLIIDGGTHSINDAIYGVAGGGFRDTNGWLAWLTANAFPGFYAGDHVGAFNWWLRLLTGVLAAWGLAFGLLPRLDGFFRQEAKRYCDRRETLEPPIRSHSL